MKIRDNNRILDDDHVDVVKIMIQEFLRKTEVFC